MNRFPGLLRIAAALILSTVLAQAQEDATELDGTTCQELGLRKTLVQIPRDMTGFTREASRPDELQGLYSLWSWIALGQPLVITADSVPEVSDPGLQLTVATLSRLLEAYRTLDPDRILGLYDEKSRDELGKRFRGPRLRAAWLESVGRARSLELLMLYVVPGKNEFHVLMRLVAVGDAGETKRIYYPAVLNADFTLKKGRREGPLHNNLSAFFFDGTRDPKRLIANYDLLHDHFKSPPRRERKS